MSQLLKVVLNCPACPLPTETSWTCYSTPPQPGPCCHLPTKTSQTCSSAPSQPSPCCQPWPTAQDFLNPVATSWIPELGSTLPPPKASRILNPRMQMKGGAGLPQLPIFLPTLASVLATAALREPGWYHRKSKGLGSVLSQIQTLTLSASHLPLRASVFSPKKWRRNFLPLEVAGGWLTG